MSEGAAFFLAIAIVFVGLSLSNSWVAIEKAKLEAQCPTVEMAAECNSEGCER